MKYRRSTNLASKINRRRHWNITRLEDRVTPALLYPNLQVLQSYLPTGTVTVNAAKEIRFSTALANAGQGPFDLRANGQVRNNSDGTQDIFTNQRVYNDVNTNGIYDLSTDTTFVDQFAGYFSYHATHGHMHFNEFAIARLRIRPTDQSLGPVVAVGPKTSFCLIDINHFAPSLPGSPASVVYGCSAVDEGISVGWADVYSSGLDGQFINVTNIPNGDYWLEVECDYANHIQETVETDNVSRTAITISNQPVTGFQIASSTPLGAQQTPVDHVDFTFNQLVDPTTFTSATVNLTGPSGNIPVTVQQVDGANFRVNFAAQASIGTYTMVLSPTIKNSTGKFIDQNNNGTGGETGDGYSNIFTVTAPYISGVSPAGSTSAPISSIRVTYNRLMTSSTFTAADIISFTNPSAASLLGTVTSITPVTAGGQSAAFDIAFTAVTVPGNYTIVIGPDVSDPNGNLVDQNKNGTPNEIADQYTNIFSLPVAPTNGYGPDAFGYVATATAIQSVTMTGATGLTFTNTDDEAQAINLGTDKFNFYGTTYTGAGSTFVSTNALITFTAGSTAYDNNAGIISLSAPTIAVLWDDWIKGPGTPQVSYLRRDTNADLINDQLVIQWNQIRHYNTSSGDMTFEAILELNTGNRPGKIILNYTDLDQGSATYNNGAAATVGIRSNTTIGSSLSVVSNSNSFPLLGSSKAMLLSVPSVTSITRVDPNPAENGDVVFEVTFSHGVASVDPNDFTVTATGDIDDATVTGVIPTADPTVWRMMVETHTGSGTVRLDLLDNDSILSLAGAKLGGAGLLNGDYNSGEIYTIIQSPPQVVHVAYQNDGAQRSRIDNIRVAFDNPVTFAGAAEAAFQIVGPNGPITLAVDTSLSSAEQTIAKLTFTGTGVEFGSLMDGNYTLTVQSSQVNTASMALDGDANGVAGGNYTESFHRLFGDSTGDANVAANDFIDFRLFFNGTGFMFDFDNDGAVAASDFTQFRIRFGGGL